MATQIVNLSLPEELVKKIDTAAEAEYASRSEFIRQSVVKRLQTEEKDAWTALENASNEVSAKAKELGYTTDKSIVNAVKEVRKSMKSKVS